MATSKKTSVKNVLSNKSIKKMIEIVCNKSSNPLPVLDNALLTNKELVCSDLETCIIIPYNTGIYNLFPLKQLRTILDEYEGGKFSAKKIGDKSFEISFTSDSDTIHVVSEMPNEYPKYAPSENDNKKIVTIGTITPDAISQMVTALNFVGSDELRVVMSNVSVFDQVVSTDAHKMYFEDIKGNSLSEQSLFTRKAIKLMQHVGGEWTIQKEKQFASTPDKNGIIQMLSARIICTSLEGIQIIFHECGDRYPNYKAVISTEFNSTMTIDSEKLQSILKRALKFANQTTHQIKFDIKDSSINFFAADLDFQNEYKTTTEVKTTGQEIEIGFNGEFIQEFTKLIDGEMTFEMSAPNRAAVINKKFLVMPVMLNN